jgi:hypothetical protein
MDQIKAGGGKATRTTFEGGTLKASAEGDNIVLTDDKGGKQTVTIADVIHVEFSWNSFFFAASNHMDRFGFGAIATRYRKTHAVEFAGPPSWMMSNMNCRWLS